MITYTARDLRDIAAAFDRRGDQAEGRVSVARTTAEANGLEREARVWREAADILRSTTLAA